MLTVVTPHPTGDFTSCAPEHCAACVHGNDGGILGNAFACAVDSVARWPWEPCAHVAAFAIDTRPLEERYPAYDPKMFRSTDRFLGKLMLEKAAQGKGSLAVIPGIGTVYTDAPRRQINEAAFRLDPYEKPEGDAA